MCGIVGVLSNHEVAPILLEALKRLEYRGYDSAGIATIQNGVIDRRRAEGKLFNLSDLLVHNPLPGKSGIGHTRWATHGEVSVKNAHPHHFGRVCVVHNGIIENFHELTEELITSGLKPCTDTDTEIIAMLVELQLQTNISPLNAIRNVICQLKGAFALCFLFEGEEDLIIATRQGAPLTIGYGIDEMYIGSDAIALAPFTKKISYLEDGDIAIVKRSRVQIECSGKQVDRQIKEINLNNFSYDKKGYKHFMEKEICEQPDAISKAMSIYLKNSQIDLGAPDINFSHIERISLVACGTAAYACLVAKYWFEKLTRITTDVEVASEFRYREPPIASNTLAIFVSQSGETADTLSALEYVIGKAKNILTITNSNENSIARKSEHNLEIFAGPEIAVASTKAFTCQLFVLLLIALEMAIKRDKISNEFLSTQIMQLKDLPKSMEKALKIKNRLQPVAYDISKCADTLFIGRGQMFPIALEGALKLKEISYIHAEGYAAGELKHGPIALVDNNVPVVVIAPKDSLFEKTLSNLSEVLARKGKVYLLTDRKGRNAVDNEAIKILELPKCPEILAPILYAIPIQMLAYFTALEKGTDVDQPRNLAKSVTVE